MKVFIFFLFIIAVSSNVKPQQVVPLTLGNKWIFNVVETNNGSISNSYVKIYKIISDTIINNQQYCKVKITFGMNNSYTYWSSDSNYFSVLSQYSLDTNYYSYVKRDTSWGIFNEYMLGTGGYIKLYEMDVLGISGCKVQEKWTHSRRMQNEGDSKYITGLGFGPVEIESIYQSDVLNVEQVDSETIKGALINGTIYGDTIITSINKLLKQTDKFQLSQNYPNPFNPTTTITYSIPKESFVTLKLYDVLGRELQTLISGEKKAGSYKVIFNGEEYSSGIYFYIMHAGDFIDVKKLILLK